MKLPQRPEQHNLEELSRRFFERNLPRNWAVSRPDIDYGVDLIVHIFDKTNTSPYEIHVQLKSSLESEPGENEKVMLRVATYNYLRKMLPVVLLVKYINSTDEAYYILLAKIPEPNQEQETFTVNIPKVNTLSTIDWQPLENLIRDIVDYKLAAGQEVQNAMRETGLWTAKSQ